MLIIHYPWAPAGGWGTKVSSAPPGVIFFVVLWGAFFYFFLFMGGAYFSMWGLLTSFSSLYLLVSVWEPFCFFFLYVGAIWGAFIWGCPLPTKISADAHAAILFPPISKACANIYFEPYAASFLWRRLDLRIEYYRPIFL